MNTVECPDCGNLVEPAECADHPGCPQCTVCGYCDVCASEAAREKMRT